MPGANYTMGNGGYNLTTDIGGGGMGMGTNPDLEFFREMAQRKAAQSDFDRARRIRLEDEAMGRALAPQVGGGPSAIDRQLDMSNKRAQILQNDAMTQAPMLDPLIQLGNTGNAYQFNPLHMNAFQRKAYLPNEVGIAGQKKSGGGDGGGGEGSSMGSEEGPMESYNSQAQRLHDANSKGGGADFYGLGSYGNYAPIEDDRQRRR